MDEKKKRLKKAAQDALAVQDACNLSGVVNAFSRAMTTIRENTNGTEEANHHPIAVLFADKIMDMVGRPELFESCKAYDACKELAE